MSYPYPNDYPQSNERIGYSGPIPVNMGDGDIAAGVTEPIDSRELIRKSIERILGTSKGSRVMRPNFGNTIKAILFEPIDGFTETDLKENIIKVLTKEEPRISINVVSLTLDPDNHCIKVVISLKYKRTGVEDSFNFIIK
jgi:phage baseplate assembly protein W